MAKSIFTFSTLLATLVFCVLTSAQETTDKKKLLESMYIYPYPSLEELQVNKLKSEWLDVEPLSSKDFNYTVDKYDDLGWLKPIVKDNKVILIGENHYYQVIHNLRNRIVFALNTWDYYPLIIFENEYSNGAFLDYFIGIGDDKKAYDFYDKACYNLVKTVEDSIFLEHLRWWNKINTGKRIHIGYSDIEHDYKSTLKDIIFPYFKKIDASFQADVDTISLIHLGNLIPQFELYLSDARKINLIGQYEFINTHYISNVIENLKSTFKAYRYEFSYYRQKAMVRNLTDKRFLGEYFIKGKVIIHGGGYHAVTHFPYPDGGNFYREGSYLTYNFKPTKGKTFSIMMWGQAYSFGDAANINLDSSLFPKRTYYGKTIDQFQRAYKQGFVTKEENYLIGQWVIDEYDKMIFKKGYDNDNEPYRITKIEWDSIISAAKVISSDLYKTAVSHKDELTYYDAIIYLTNSPIIRAKMKK